jgi:hypothetical protein
MSPRPPDQPDPNDCPAGSYYYDDATGYEIYRPEEAEYEEDEPEDADSRP